MKDLNSHEEKCSFRFIDVSEQTVNEFKIHFSNSQYIIKEYFKNKQRFVITVDDFVDLSVDQVLQFIKKNDIPFDSYGLYVSLATDRDSDGVHVSRDILDFYKRIGGTLDFSFTSV